MAVENIHKFFVKVSPLNVGRFSENLLENIFFHS